VELRFRERENPEFAGSTSEKTRNLRIFVKT
jgi:hypothetical protein